MILQTLAIKSLHAHDLLTFEPCEVQEEIIIGQLRADSAGVNQLARERGVSRCVLQKKADFVSWAFLRNV